MKRLITVLLVLALVLSMSVVPAFAWGTGKNVTAGSEQCPCGCGSTVDAVQWEPWNGTSASGHYYLEEDYSQSGELTVASGAQVVIDLRGKTLSTADYSRLFTVEGYLAVLDTVGGGRMCAKTSGSDGGVVAVAGSSSSKTATFALYSGTVTLDADNKGANLGGLIHVGSYSYFKMYGGKLLGGTANKGGAIYASSTSTSQVQILGGSILGCSSENHGGAIYALATLTLSNCTLSGNEAGEYGGNIYASGGSMTVENTVIENGVSNSSKAGYGGGNIYATGGCAVTIENSTVRNGYTVETGGNIYFGKGTQSLTNTKISGGVAGAQGGNIYCNVATATTTLDGCEISGDVYYGAGALTLSGDTKIGLNNTGLKVASDVTLTTSDLTSGAEIYTDSESASGTYFKTDYCPHCGEQVTWSELSDTPSGHCYLTADQTITSAYEITADTVVDLRGYSITSSDRAFAVTADGTLAILDSVGGGAVQGSGNADDTSGGVIYNAGTLYIYGGNLTYVADADKPVTTGGVVHTDGTMELHGGVLDGSAFAQTASGYNGGAVCQSDGSRTFTMTAGRIVGGSAYRGGGAYFGYSNTVTITGGSFAGGASGNGGCIRFAGSSGKTGTASVSGVSISGGETDESSSAAGGNVGIGYYTVDFSNCWISGGSAAAYAGNLSLGTGAKGTFTNCIMFGGTAPKGGNVYSASTSVTATFTDCLLTGGTATENHGGNLYVNNGKVTVAGGEISYGSAAGRGGNVYNCAPTSYYLQFTADGETAPMIVGGYAGVYGGNVYSTGILELLSAFISNGSAVSGGNDLYYRGGSLTVGAGLTGDISMYIHSDLLGTNVIGASVENSTAEDFSATITLEGDYGDPKIIAKDGVLYVELPFVGVATVVNAAGEETWYASNAEALQACPEDGYVKLYTTNDLVLTKDCFVDLNGNAVSVSGDFTLYGMDSSGDDYSVGTGSATWLDAETVNTAAITEAPNDNRYVPVTEDATVTYHRLDMVMKSVSLRTSACGIYYKAAYNCDSVLAQNITSYGVVFSLQNMPDSDFKTEEDDINRYTRLTPGEDFGQGTVATSGSVFNIMVDSNTAESNKSRGEMEIYANAYVEVNGQTFVGDTDNVDKTVDDDFDGVAYSLLGVMEALDEKIATDPTNYRKYTLTARSFYEKWLACGMQDWTFGKIPEPADDDVIDVLMIGSSYCYYYVEELYGIAEAAGIPMRVCNVYYSGCTLEKHYTWWVNGESNYNFFITDENGRNTAAEGVSLEYCLAQGDWDVISLQEAPSAIRRSGGAEAHLEVTATYTDALIPYLQEQFPEAEVCWHQTWAVQIGYVGSDSSMESAEQQVVSMNRIRDYSLGICEKYGVTRINTGEAWQIAREANDYDNLCARLGVNNDLGDYYHDGDIGGGQYLNACVWFEILTGESCVGNTYRPTYELDEGLGDDPFGALQAAAHEAVLQLSSTEE